MIKSHTTDATYREIGGSICTIECSFSDGGWFVRVKELPGCMSEADTLDEALANLGQIKYREIPSADLGAANRREGQIMIRHPNASGMQMDQRTNSYIPARYIDQLVVKQGDDLLFQMDGGISISEDPNFRFTFVPNGAKALSIEAHDTDGKVFRLVAPLGSAS